MYVYGAQRAFVRDTFSPDRRAEVGRMGKGGRRWKISAGNSNMPLATRNGCAWNAFESLIVLRKHIFLVLPILQRRALLSLQQGCAVRLFRRFLLILFVFHAFVRYARAPDYDGRCSFR